jgi:Methyltransferase domain
LLFKNAKVAAALRGGQAVGQVRPAEGLPADSRGKASEAVCAGDGVTLAQRIGDYSSPTSIGSRFRRKRIAPLLDMIISVASEKGGCSIIDVGGTRKYWEIVPIDFLRQHKVSILITNIDDNIGETGNLEGTVADHSEEIFTFARADACSLPYPEKSFDILHSNSVIEHVGDWDHKVSFSKETNRVAASYFVQTPNYWFPWEPHFGTFGFQFLPVPLQVSLVMAKRRGFRPRSPTVDAAMHSIETCQLLDARRFRALFPDAEFIRERFLGLTKSLIAIRRSLP